MKTNEILKLALEGAANYIDALGGDSRKYRQELAKPDFWEGYIPEPDKRQQALDKKAENARELGLDYEPAQQEPVAKDNSNYRFDPPGLDPSHQKPVAWWIPKAKQFCLPSSDGTRPFAKAWEPLYTSPPAQRTWVGLTDEERNQIWSSYRVSFVAIEHIEAKLKEKNT